MTALFATIVGAGEQGVLPVKGERADAAFDGAAAEFDTTTVEESGQPFPAGERIADRFGECTFAADLREPGVEEPVQFIDDR